MSRQPEQVKDRRDALNGRLYSVVDFIKVLTESENPTTHWRVLKKRLKDEGNEAVTNRNGLKMRSSDGK